MQFAPLSVVQYTVPPQRIASVEVQPFWAWSSETFMSPTTPPAMAIASFAVFRGIKIRRALRMIQTIIYLLRKVASLAAWPLAGCTRRGHLKKRYATLARGLFHTLVVDDVAGGAMCVIRKTRDTRRCTHSPSASTNLGRGNGGKRNRVTDEPPAPCFAYSIQSRRPQRSRASRDGEILVSVTLSALYARAYVVSISP
jgi:hypothetical protein